MINKLSVIVPVYNKEDYLERSLSSIKNQTYKNIEIIIIDDGSTDRSKEICLKFCTEDTRFKYFYKKNGGVASARNLGLDKASGEYIGFVDPDDYIDSCMYEKMLNVAIAKNIDIVECGVKRLQNNSTDEITISKDYELTSHDAAIHLIKWENAVTPYLWNKIFRRTVVNGIKFKESLKVGEDLPFIFESILCSSSYMHIHNYLYTYVKYEDSLVGITYKGDSAKNSIESSLYVCKLSSMKYFEYIDVCNYGLLLNCYFQINRILREKTVGVLWQDFYFFRDVAYKIDKKVIKTYGSKWLILKIILCFKFPHIYRGFLKIKQLFENKR